MKKVRNSKEETFENEPRPAFLPCLKSLGVKVKETRFYKHELVITAILPRHFLNVFKFTTRQKCLGRIAVNYKFMLINLVLLLLHPNSLNKEGTQARLIFKSFFLGISYLLHACTPGLVMVMVEIGFYESLNLHFISKTHAEDSTRFKFR